MTKQRTNWLTPQNVTWLLLAAAVVFIYIFALDVPLLGPDEPRYSQVAREMFDKKDWVTPTLGGFNWFEKPALLYWLQITFYGIFGVSEFSARLGSALFGLSTIVSVAVVGKSISQGESTQETELRPQASALRPQHSDLTTQASDLRPQHSSRLPHWIALVMATSLGLIAFSRGASFDIIITLPIAASLAGFFVWDQSESNGGSRARGLAGLILFYVFIGVGLIAKGLIGIVFPFAIVSFYLLLSRRWPSKTLLISVFWGTLVSLLVAALWYLPMYLTHGWEFIEEFFVQHHFQRFTSNKYKHPGPFWFFWAILPAMTIPWIPFFLAAVWRGVAVVVKGKQTQDTFSNTPAKKAGINFAFAWMLVPLVFFSLSGSKLPGYILPALPACAILTGLYVDGFTIRARWRTTALHALAFAMLTVVTVLLAVALPRFAYDDSVKYMVENANSRGFADSEILNMNTISHSLEFYGAGRLVRGSNGDQWKFLTAGGIAEHIKKNNGKPVLVVIPNNLTEQLTESELVSAEVLDKHDELSIFAVKLKKQTGNDL